MTVGYVERQRDGNATATCADVENGAGGANGGTIRHMLCDEAAQVLRLWAGYQDAGLYVILSSAEVGNAQHVLHGFVICQSFGNFFQFCLVVC